MHEVVLLGNIPCQSQSFILLAHAWNIYHHSPVAGGKQILLLIIIDKETLLPHLYLGTCCSIQGSHENQGHLQEELCPCRQQICLFDRPEPQSTPVIQGKFQPRIRPGVLHFFRAEVTGEDLILLPDSGMGGLLCILMPIDGQLITGLLLQFVAHGDDFLPQAVYGFGQANESPHFVIGIGSSEFLLPRLDGLDFLRLQAPYDLIRVVCHAGISQQEMPDFRLGGTPVFVIFRQRTPLRSQFIPARPFDPGLQMLFVINLPARAHQGVAVNELGPEPGHKTAFINCIQPKGDFCQLYRHRIQVDTVDIPVGNEHFHPLQLGAAFCRRDRFL